MRVLANIPFSLDEDKLMRKMRIAPTSNHAREFQYLLQLASESANPKALYRETFIETKGQDTIVIEGLTFTSRILRKNLDAVERVFPYIATCGDELDQIFSAKGDYLKEFWWDVIKAHLLEAAKNHLNNHLQKTFRLNKISSMSPGSGDLTVWPIEQQEYLFRLLGDVTAHIGVRLTDSLLMVPTKTISGIKYQADRDFRSCQLCRREKCQSRNVAFDPELWETLQHD